MNPRNGLRRALCGGLLALGLGCDSPPAAPPADAAREDLRMGYSLLAETLEDESRLGGLKLFKKLTFQGPVEEVGEVMEALAETSGQRAEQLEALRELSPDVTGEPAKHSPIGDAIRSVAKEAGKSEMLSGDEFDIRFVLLQAQATRTIAAMARAIASHEPNPERRSGLEEVATEYEAHRDRIVAIIHAYSEGRGEAQQGR